MTHRLIRSLALATLLVGAAGACSDPLSPREVTGTYVVADLGSLVARDHRVLGDTLLLYPDGTGSWRRHVEFFEPNPAQQRFMTSDRWVDYRINGNRLTATVQPCSTPRCLVALGPSHLEFLIDGEGLLLREGGLRFVRR